MDKVGIKFHKLIDYEYYEPLQYWLDYDFEYEDLEEYIEQNKIIELELEEDEDREEDIEMLQTFLEKLAHEKIAYKLFRLNNTKEWEETKLKQIV